jgi:hypothetical protein
MRILSQEGPADHRQLPHGIPIEAGDVISNLSTSDSISDANQHSSIV